MHADPAHARQRSGFGDDLDPVLAVCGGLKGHPLVREVRGNGLF
ncbi:hypothetical protein [Aliigemmobacter aestuarii]|nr:hypothetical protein [Gemmobacter aestuarii]